MENYELNTFKNSKFLTIGSKMNLYLNDYKKLFIELINKK